jgi:hypothetical protein
MLWSSTGSSASMPIRVARPAKWIVHDFRSVKTRRQIHESEPLRGFASQLTFALVAVFVPHRQKCAARRFCTSSDFIVCGGPFIDTANLGEE